MNKKDLGIIFGLFLAIALLIIFGRGFTSLRPIQSVDQATASANAKNNTNVKIRDFVVNAMITDKPEERKVGLSKIDSMPLDSGMLFVFDKEDKYAIWMKNMKFAIDIVWIDKDKKIVSVAKNVPTEPGKNDKELTVYKPNVNSLYILELNAGIVDLHGLAAGDAVAFTL